MNKYDIDEFVYCIINGKVELGEIYKISRESKEDKEIAYFLRGKGFYYESSIFSSKEDLIKSL